jgi:hypothetical protein
MSRRPSTASHRPGSRVPSDSCLQLFASVPSRRCRSRSRPRPPSQAPLRSPTRRHSSAAWTRSRRPSRSRSTRFASGCRGRRPSSRASGRIPLPRQRSASGTAFGSGATDPRSWMEAPRSSSARFDAASRIRPSSRTGCSSKRRVEAESRRCSRRRSAQPKPIEAYRAGRTCHPRLPFADWDACRPVVERLGAVLVAGCRDAAAARQLGFVPTHGVAAALEMARGLAGGDPRIGFLLAPPYFPIRVGDG